MQDLPANKTTIWRNFVSLGLRLSLAGSLLIGGISSSAFALGDDKAKDKDKDKDKAKEAPSKDEIKSLDEMVKKCRKISGLFTLYQDSTSGSVYMQISKAQLGREYIYFVHSTDGVSAAGHFRGSYRDTKVFKVGKHYNKVEFTVQNTSYYYDSTKALSKAANANVSNALLYSGAIVGQNKDKTEYLVKADELFLTEVFHQVKPNARPGQQGAQFSLGSLSKDKSKYTTLRNYPLNTDVVVQYVYDNPSPVGGGDDIADAHSVMVSVQHSFIEVPKNDFVPRRDDARVGYFGQEQQDMTSNSATPYHDYINRWHLVRKDAGSALSDPVEPITWWIEKTTPVELRPMILKAGAYWNQAFEAAGFKNAVVMKEQSDTATWDAGDIRYNVLRWTSSPNPPFGGYGPSFVNPRTGQILGADIMLEWVFLTNKIMQGETYETAAMPSQLKSPLDGATAHDPHLCLAGHYLQHNLQFGLTALDAMGLAAVEKARFIEEGVYYLILHEMGHTMGLMHNMKSSQLHGVPAVYDRTITQQIGLTGSVMEYPAANIPSDNTKPCQYFTTKPGPYDLWAITYGYSPAATNATAEEARLTKILSRSVEPSLAFGNDADDMREAGKAIDPRVMIGDLSSDAITFATNRLELVNKVLPTLKAKYTKPGASFHELRDRYLRLTAEKGIHAGVISRYVGGVLVDRSVVGQKANITPFTPVALADQKRAMAALNTYLFAPDAHNQATDVYNFLAMQRRGFNLFSGTEDPKITGRVLVMQREVLGHLLHPNVVQRLTDSELYGNKYKLNDMMGDLTNSIFKADAATAVNPFRQNLQAEYVDMLIKGAGLIDDKKSPYTYAGQAAALAQLMNIRTQLATSLPVADGSTKAHRQALAFRINREMKR